MAYAATVTAVATTANINISSPGGSSNFDNATLAAGARVLLTSQTTTPSQNGVWIWHGPTTPMSRPTLLQDQYQSGNTLDNNTLIPVVNGNTYAGTCWGLDPSQVMTVDTTAHTLTRVVLPPIQVRAATNHDVNLSSAIMNVDGVTTSSTPPLTGNGLAGSDLVLVKNQTNAANNGVYWVNTTGASARATEPLIPGREVLVNQGTQNAHTLWSLVTAGPLVVGTTSLTFSRQFTKVNVRDWNAAGDGVTDDSTAIANAIASVSSSGGTVTLPQSGGNYLIGTASTVTFPSNVQLSFEEGAVLEGNGLVTVNGAIIASDEQQIFAGGSTWTMTQTGTGQPSVGLVSSGSAWTVTSLVVTITSVSTFEYQLNGGTPVTGLTIPAGVATYAGTYAISGTPLVLLFPVGTNYPNPYLNATYSWARGGTVSAAPGITSPSIVVAAGVATAPTLEYGLQLQITIPGAPGTGWFALSVDGGPLTFPITAATQTTPIDITVPGVNFAIGQTIYLSGSASPFVGLSAQAYTISANPSDGVWTLAGTSWTSGAYGGTGLVGALGATQIPVGGGVDLNVTVL